MPPFTRHCWFLTGPTASGKSSLALSVAERAGAEIVAMDSMTLYRGMDIGTDKPTAEARARVPHHLLDLFDPSESASLDRYLDLAEEAVGEIRARGRQPLLVGGTPLYLKACLRGIFAGPPADPAFRQRLTQEAQAFGTQALHQRLAEVDPASARTIQPGDLRRIIRALEVLDKTGRPISEWQQEFDRPARPAPPVACLVPTREDRHRRINQRVVDMLAQGWVDEVRQLLSRDPAPGKVALQAVGYEEIINFLNGSLGEAELAERIQTRTRQLSKRQMTWFRHIEECVFFPLEELGDHDQAVEKLLRFFRTATSQIDPDSPLAGDTTSTRQ